MVVSVAGRARGTGRALAARLVLRAESNMNEHGGSRTGHGPSLSKSASSCSTSVTKMSACLGIGTQRVGAMDSPRTRA